MQAVTLAVIQGLTEFLPISSSAHLILVPRILGWEDQGLAFDVAVHVGTEVAVVGYFRREVGGMLRDWVRSIATRETVGDSRLAWGVAVGTIPVGLAGLMLGGAVEQQLRSPLVIATTTIVFGLALWWADRASRRDRSEHEMGWWDFVLIGCAQALAIVPGTSRSGITITAALALGLDRASAARFSFLLAIPVILLAGGSEAVGLIRLESGVEWTILLLAGGVAAVSAFACIHVFLKALERIGMLPFVAYRLILGVVLIALFV